VTSRILAVAILIGLAWSCGGEPVVSDTGYVGTWTRGSERSRSTIAIVPDGDGYRFRVKMTTDNASRETSCDWEGLCIEKTNGKPVREHRFRTRVDPASGHLVVACESRRFDADEPDLHYVDELVVDPGGRTLQSYTIERDGVEIEARARPKRTFKKISDEVASPPEPRSR